MSNIDTFVIAGQYRFPDVNAAATRAMAMANLLQSLGKSVVLVGVSDTTNTIMPVLNSELSEKTGYETFEVSSRSSSKVLFKFSIHQLKPLLHSLREQRVALVLYNSGAFALISALLNRRRQGYYLLQELTEWYTGDTAQWYYSLARRFDTYLRMKVLNRRCDGLIVCSQYLEDYYQDSVARVFFLPGLIDRKKSHAQFGAKLSSPTLEGEHVRFCYAGEAFNKRHIDKQRTNIKDRLDVVIDLLYLLYSQRKNWQFDIYGARKDDFLDVFPCQAEKLRVLAEHVVFHGRVPRKVILTCYVTAHFSLFFRYNTLSNMAGFPTKLAESMMYGCPVITNHVDRSAQWVIDGQNGIVLNQDSEQAMVQSLVAACDMDSPEVLTMKMQCQLTGALQADNYRDGLTQFLSQLA